MDNLRQQLFECIDGTDINQITIICAKIAIRLEEQLEYLSELHMQASMAYATYYQAARREKTQGDADISAKKKSLAERERYEKVKNIESGYKSILSAAKDRIRYLEQESQNNKMKNFERA
jgi:hypothetical protein